MVTLLISAFFLLFALCAAYTLYRFLRLVDEKYELGLFASKLSAVLVVLGCIGFAAV